MPTILPTPPRRVDKKRSLFSTVFNTFMVVSALALTFMVLVQEQRFANGQPGPLAGALTNMMQQAAVDPSGESRVIAPTN